MSDFPEFRVFNSKEAYKVTKDEELWICQAFSLLNSLQTDTSSKRDCKKAFTALGFNIANDDVKMLIDKLSENDETGPVIDFNTFFNLMKTRLLENQSQLEMKAVFSLFDVHGTGRLDTDAIKKVLSSIGEHFDDNEIEDMIDEVDSNNDGVITEEDFMRLLRRSVE